MYNMAQIVARYADVEDENVLGASNHLEDELADEVFELKKYIKELEARL